ncbi:MAG: DNA Methyltransferase [Phormidium phage MIS-PhV1A]|uniref:DNA methyltransferase n=1 Tax=Phormidium phage MIS-PhV1A TaxID=1391455 RepID=UPI0003C97A39|nr:MAG: DNA methyltransferase [Phormidium phage MIS-PhV1A]AGZ61752.1 MAG: DNA Methyltransferase [Phormidium phage MIS-PhV1A]
MYKSDDKIGQLKLSIALNLVPNLPPIPCKDYRLIVVDPPWSYSLRETDATHRGRCPYPSMSDEQILNLPIGAIAHQNSYLLLWVTNNHLPLGFRCLERWGFTYKSIFTWVKTTKASTEEKPIANMGIGHYGRNCTEHFLIATRGNPGSFTSHGLTDIRNIIFAPRSKHSEKPPEFWTIADRLAEHLDGPRIELFARSSGLFKREGWDSWGAETD